MGAVVAYRDPSSLRIEEFSQLYARLGLSDVFMMTLFLALPLATALAASFVIVIRRPDDRGALVLAAGLAALFLFVSGFAASSDLAWLGQLTTSISVVLMAALLTTFPTGTFEPRWSMAAPTLVLAVALVQPALASETRTMLSQATMIAESSVTLASASWAVAITVAICAQVVRYRRISTPVERRQSLWVVFGALFILLPASILLVLVSAGISRAAITAGLVGASALGSYVFQGAVLIAVFRFHLYEIDRLISRTITYGVVAVAVGLLYGLLVILLPTVLGGSGDLVIAAATLAAATAFNPIRVRVRRVVERRFNRARYDADRELAGFIARLSEQVDIGLITADLEDTLIRTLQPRHLAVWVRPMSAPGA